MKARGMTMKTELDDRWSIRREWCGYEMPHHVVRFCDDWVGQAETKEAAQDIAKEHRDAFYKSMGIAP